MCFFILNIGLSAENQCPREDYRLGRLSEWRVMCKCAKMAPHLNFLYEGQRISRSKNQLRRWEIKNHDMNSWVLQPEHKVCQCFCLLAKIGPFGNTKVSSILGEKVVEKLRNKMNHGTGSSPWILGLSELLLASRVPLLVGSSDERYPNSGS